MRVRFAPSPTGYLHVGGARTALYNWLAARSSEGVFILRSDDTDAERSSAEFYDDIIDGLRWLGLDWDEGIEAGGPHAPYRQSLRLDRYREVATQLLDSGAAYPCFCTPGELDERRREAQAAGRPPGYDGRCRSLAREVAEGRRSAGEPAVTRLAVPRPGETAFVDVVRGEVQFDHDNVEDFVILRSDGSPTYHLASSVDDVDFGITQVVRGEDLLSSTPKHILLTEAMGAEPITYAHLSLLMGPDGKKLSKRHGDTSLRAYREAGFLPGAMVNYLALLGWSYGDEESTMSKEEMATIFRLDAVSKNPAIFDNDKLEWLNGVYMREMLPEAFLALAIPLIERDLGRGLSRVETEQLASIAAEVQERVKRLEEVPDQVRFLFVEELSYDVASWDKVMTKPETAGALAGAIPKLEAVPDWTTAEIEAALRAMLEEEGLNARKGLQPVRVAVTGSSVSPPLFESVAALGRDRTLERLRVAQERM